MPEPSTAFSTSGPRRSPQTNKRQYASTRYINEVFLAAVQQLPLIPYHEATLAYLAELQTDMDTSQLNITDPRVYNARYTKQKHDPDTPTFHQAMSGEEADKYISAMKEEVTNLKRMNTWIVVDCDAKMKVLKGTGPSDSREHLMVWLTDTVQDSVSVEINKNTASIILKHLLQLFNGTPFVWS